MIVNCRRNVQNEGPETVTPEMVGKLHEIMQQTSCRHSASTLTSVVTEFAMKQP